MSGSSAARRVRYQVACSLDGYIASPDGSYDWIVMDPDIDFKALTSEFDTVLVGGRTWAGMTAGGPAGRVFGMRTFVFSRTIDPAAYPEVTVVADHAPEIVAALREESGKDIWLFGGGLLFQSLLEAGVVDTVEVAVMTAAGVTVASRITSPLWMLHTMPPGAW